MKEENDLKERTKQFALRVIRLFGSLPKTTVAQVLGKHRRLRRTPAAPRQSLPPRRRCTGQAGAGVFGRANFAAEHRRLQQERLAAFREYIADVHEGRFPERSHLVEMDAPFLDEVVRAISGASPVNEG